MKVSLIPVDAVQTSKLSIFGASQFLDRSAASLLAVLKVFGFFGPATRKTTPGLVFFQNFCENLELELLSLGYARFVSLIC